MPMLLCYTVTKNCLSLKTVKQKRWQKTSRKGPWDLMAEKSHCPQIGGSDWDGIMVQVVQIYAEETISCEQVSQMSERICARINAKVKSGELHERHFISATGGACEIVLRSGNCS